MKQLKIRAKKDGILSKKLVKKINGNHEDDTKKKNKKKKSDKKKENKFQKQLVYTEKKKKDKGKKKHKKFKKKKSSNALVVKDSKNVLPSNATEVVSDIMKILKKNMDNQVKLTKLVGKLVK